MPLRSWKPTSPGRRNAMGYTFGEITKKKPEKRLLATKKQRAGRNRDGRISVRHRGGGHKRRIRIVDFRRDKDGVPGRVAAIECSVLVVTGAPDRAARLSLRNIPGASAAPADVLNVADVLAHRSLLLTVGAVRRIEALWGGERANGRPAAPPPAPEAAGA